MKRMLLASGALALSLAAMPAMAQGYYDGYYSRYDAPITGARLTDFPSSRANVTQSGSFLALGTHYGASHSDYYYGDRDYYRDRDYPRGYHRRYDRDDYDGD